MSVSPAYDRMQYRRCGTSGVVLPMLSLGLWHNFGTVDPFEESRAMIRRAFELGITHFDLANNYGPEPGSAEETFGRVLRRDLSGHRDELIISTKAGWRMWPGPYGDGGSRKYLLASLDQSLDRLGLDYVDIFYSHRVDPSTPLEETMGALDSAVRQGKALYVGISAYDADATRAAAAMLRSLGTRCFVHQPKYNMLVRDVEGRLLYANQPAREALAGMDLFEGAPDLQPRLAALGGRLSPLRVGGLELGEAMFIPGLAGATTLAAREKEAIVKTLDAHSWKLAETARSLGISRTTLWRRLKAYGLHRDGRSKWAQTT